MFLTPRYAYKLKKPLRRGSMDYRTLGARARACREEVRLNRRLAPAIYQSVQVLSSDRAGRLHLGAGARVEDYLIRMRRLPRPRMLDRALAGGTVSPRMLARLVRRLVPFFAAARRHPLPGSVYRRRLRTEVQRNRRALQRLGARIRQSRVAQASGAQLQFIALDAVELAARGRRIVEGHGDLRAEHVCLAPPISVIDCLEFDRTLRLLDPAHEMALLALEIARLGGESLAWELLWRFCSLSGERVSAPTLHFYMSLCASSRAKLAAWHVGDPQFPAPRPWLRRTDSLLQDAVRYGRRALQELEQSNQAVTRTIGRRGFPVPAQSRARPRIV